MTYEQMILSLIRGEKLTEEELQSLVELKKMLNALQIGEKKTEIDDLHKIYRGKVVAK
jgi:hypothetical protein